MGLGLQEANVLARAVKEQERREGNLEGFTATPADCMAFKYYRDVGFPCLGILV